MKNKLLKISVRIEEQACKLLKITPPDGGVPIFGSAMFPIMLEEGIVGIVGDGEIQGIAKRSGHNWISEEGSDGEILGVGILFSEEALLNEIEDIVLSEENIKEASHNIVGGKFQRALAKMFAETMTA